LAGCAEFDLDKLDVFGLTKKKPLPGERRDVFPQGVPGVSQGVPPELTRGYQAPADSTPDPVATAAAQAAQEQAAKQAAAKPKPKPKQTAKRTPPTAPAGQSQQSPYPAQQQSQPSNAPWPSQAPQQAQAPAQSQAPWPSQQQQQPQQTTAPWPGSSR